MIQIFNNELRRKIIMAKIINLEEIQKNTKKLYETCSDISILQRELEEMLIAIEKNSMDFEKGKISKDLFRYNEDRMKKESANIIKKINSLIDSGTSLIEKINKEVNSQRIEAKEKKKDRIKEIKKKMKPKKRVKKIKRPKKMAKSVTETPSVPVTSPAPTPEQNV